MKRMIHPCITKVMAKPKIGDEKRVKTMYGCTVENPCSPKFMKIALQEKDLLR